MGGAALCTLLSEASSESSSATSPRLTTSPRPPPVRNRALLARGRRCRRQGHFVLFATTMSWCELHCDLVATPLVVVARLVCSSTMRCATFAVALSKGCSQSTFEYSANQLIGLFQSVQCLRRLMVASGRSRPC